MNIRIMTSNIWGSYAKEHCIANRDDLLAEIYLKYKPVIIGFQEFSPKIRGEENNLNKLISSEYTEIPIIATNERKCNFTPIFYRHDTVTPTDYGWFYFSGLNDIGSKSVTWCKFEDNDTKVKFLMMNTHYYWTNDEPGREARISNTEELKALYNDINPEGLPTFLTGDFNCRSAEPPITELINFGFKESRFVAEEPVEKIKSHKPYPTLDNSDPDDPRYLPSVRPTDAIDESIDHIFVYGNVAVKRYITVIDEQALAATDHCPLYIDAEI